MKISKSLFKNLSRCDNFASLYDMYTFRNMHHITRIYGEPDGRVFFYATTLTENVNVYVTLEYTKTTD